MLQVLRQLFDAFARLLLEAVVYFNDLGDQNVIGLTDGLSGDVRRPRGPPVRDGVQGPADNVAILRHQPLKVLGQLRRTQLEPNEEGRRRTHPRSVTLSFGSPTRRATPVPIAAARSAGSPSAGYCASRRGRDRSQASRLPRRSRPRARASRSASPR